MGRAGPALAVVRTRAAHRPQRRCVPCNGWRVPLDNVAGPGPVGEALIMTAFGLVVAIPAAIA
ncbi:TolQ protein [Mycetohabitans rhizoxinica HKI 454]|uniref:TolQ protein n=1 Tax=Mycetohabitans rhizoxinica (strain DSM 19002 / CIP 109453 / HKI 454) TaxID=882378 RepID=E5AM38_MYCRK|nr:TolQ protein [Mycetohabitans rhizoxinica HKI 454]